MGRTRRRRLAVGLGILALLAALGAGALATGLWQPWGTPAQIADAASDLFSQAGSGERPGLLVCAPPQASSTAGETLTPLYLHVGPETIVQDRRGRLLPAAARLEDLQAGQRLSIWYDGVMFSYPAQATAERVVIEEDGPGGPPECALRGLEP